MRHGMTRPKRYTAPSSTTPRDQPPQEGAQYALTPRGARALQVLAALAAITACSS